MNTWGSASKRSRRPVDRADVWLAAELMSMAGMSLGRIARVLGVTHQAVGSFLKRHRGEKARK